MKIDFSKSLKSLKGIDVKTSDDSIFTQSMLVGEVLTTTKIVGGKMKLGILAQKIYTDKVIDLDKADIELIKNALEKDEFYNNVWISQVLETLSTTDNKVNEPK